MTTMIFYERAVALNRDRHLKLKIRIRENHFSFTAGTNSVLLAGSEFAEASRDYPIVFVGKEGGPFTAAVLVGLADKENLLVDEAGVWEAGTYIPAFIRRYPFVLVGSEDAESLTVCVDESYAGLGEETGEALFSEDGKETEYLTNIVEFLRLFNSEMKRASTFAIKLSELGILTPKIITVERGGQKYTLDGLWVVDQTKLNALDDEKTLALVRSGELGLIYAHLVSLNNVARLGKRLDVKRKADAEAKKSLVAGEARTDVVH